MEKFSWKSKFLICNVLVYLVVCVFFYRCVAMSDGCGDRSSMLGADETITTVTQRLRNSGTCPAGFGSQFYAGNAGNSEATETTGNAGNTGYTGYTETAGHAGATGHTELNESA